MIADNPSARFHAAAPLLDFVHKNLKSAPAAAIATAKRIIDEHLAWMDRPISQRLPEVDPAILARRLSRFESYVEKMFEAYEGDLEVIEAALRTRPQKRKF